MDCHRGSENSGNGVNANDEDGMCDKEMSVHTHLTSNYNGRPFQLEVESEPPNKRAKNDLLEDLTTVDHKKAIEKVLYKTRLCYQFRAGSCPFLVNCDFAHSMEELRELPHNWQEILAAHKEEQTESSEQPRVVSQIPMMGLNAETQGPNMRQQCKGFLTRAGCQFGENCMFIHTEHYEERKSVAICLLPGPGGGCEKSRSKSSPGIEGGYESNGSTLSLNASNWKTKICNKWEPTGFCPYGRKCIFVHRYEEMQHDGGLPVNREVIGSSAVGANQVAAPTVASVGAVSAPVSLVPYPYRVGVQPRRLPAEIQKTGEIPIRRWKGPNKISKIYGDWIDDL